MKKDVEIVGFIHSNRAGKIDVFQASMAFTFVERENCSFNIVPAGNRLPKNFFSEKVSSIAAVVGKNSSGKTTMLEDIFRVMCGREPICTQYVLVLRADNELMQIASGDILVTYEGGTILHLPRGQNMDVKVVYYSNAYDPFSRRGPLARSDGSISAVDMSSQTIFSTDLVDKDFDCKIHYLKHISEQQISSFELQGESAFSRTISFQVNMGRDSQDAFKKLAEILVTVLNGRMQEILSRRLLSSRAVEDRDLASAVSKKIVFDDERSSFLSSWGIDYFDLVVNFLRVDCGQVGLIDDDFAFDLAIRRCINLAYDPQRQGRDGVKKDLKGLVEDSDDTLIGILGLGQFGVISGLTSLYASLTGQPNSRSDPMKIDVHDIGGENNQRFNELMTSLLNARAANFDIEFEFTGISEGQRTLLTFFSRYYSQEITDRMDDGNIVLIIDEHELGLHPEWQRKYVSQLISFIDRSTRTNGQVQVLLSSHSPFVVSDIPGSLVNIAGAPRTHADTFAANLLELLLSPVFMEQTTGEFASDKLKELVGTIRDLRPEMQQYDVEKAVMPIISQVADAVLKNYLSIEWDEAKSKAR